MHSYWINTESRLGCWERDQIVQVMGQMGQRRVKVTGLTSVSPESTSRREMRLCPSLRSSYRSVTCLWAWGHKRTHGVDVTFICNLLSASVVNRAWFQSDPGLFETPTDTRKRLTWQEGNNHSLSTSWHFITAFKIYSPFDTVISHSLCDRYTPAKVLEYGVNFLKKLFQAYQFIYMLSQKETAAIYLL